MAEAPHILIVEDQPSTAEMLTSYFESQGYEVARH
jgi:DNA-binding response OmpR family regulator